MPQLYDYTHQKFGHDYFFVPRIIAPDDLHAGLRGTVMGWSEVPLDPGDVLHLGKVGDIPSHYVIEQVVNLKLQGGFNTVYQFVAEAVWIADEQVEATTAAGVVREEVPERQVAGLVDEAVLESEHTQHRHGISTPTPVEVEFGKSLAASGFLNTGPFTYQPPAGGNGAQ